MPSVTFIAHDGTSRQVTVPPNTTLMRAAVDNGVDGIIGDCGGACACATCHCYVDAAWADRLAPPQDGEKAMLDCVIDPAETSRLSCQIKLSEELDGLVVRLPVAQY